MTILETKRAAVVIDDLELTVRIAEACMGVARPVGLSPREALAELERTDRVVCAGFRRASRAAADYIAERMNAAVPGMAQVVDGGVQ